MEGNTVVRKEQRTRQMTVRITEEMDATLRRQAQAEGIDIADIVRRALARELTTASRRP